MDAKCFQLPLASGILELNAFLPQAFRMDLFFFSLCSDRDVGFGASFPLPLFLHRTAWRKCFDFLCHKDSSLILCPVVKCSFICWPADCKDFLHEKYVSKHDMSCSVLLCGGCINDNS